MTSSKAHLELRRLFDEADPFFSIKQKVKLTPTLSELIGRKRKRKEKKKEKIEKENKDKIKKYKEIGE